MYAARGIGSRGAGLNGLDSLCVGSREAFRRRPSPSALRFHVAFGGRSPLCFTSRPGEGGRMSSREPRAPDSDRLARLVAISRRLATETDLRAVLRFLLESAIALTGAERGFFLFRRHGSVTCEASVPDPCAVPGPVPRQLSKSVLSRVLDAGESVLSTDLAADARFRARLSVRRLGVRSVL